MYKLLIAEDEPIEREALKLMISNNCTNISDIEDAENGFAAIEKCKSFCPDIVIMDINMPGLNGLDTIKALQRQNENIKFLLLSGHNRFEYAQEAIKLGVEDFILKPAKISSIKKAIDNAVEKLDNTMHIQQQNTALINRMKNIRHIVESDCIYALISNDKNNDLGFIFSFLDFEVKSGFCFVVSCQGDHQFFLNRIKKSLSDVGVKCIGKPLNNILVFFVLDCRILEERHKEAVGNFVTMLLREHGKNETFVGVGNIYTDPDKLNISYKQAISALVKCGAQNLRFFVYDNIDHTKEQINEYLNDLSDDLVSAIQNSSGKELENIVENILMQLIFDGKPLEDAKRLIYQLLIMVVSVIKDKFPSLSAEVNTINISKTGIADSRELKCYFVTTIEGIASLVNKFIVTGSSKIINRALAFIDSAYNKNISLNDISENLGVTPFYISKVLKKRTGKNFTDLIAEKRIEKAKKMLVTNKSIKEITFEVGFNSQNYFAKVFKKYTGLTPTDYKNKICSNKRSV